MALLYALIELLHIQLILLLNSVLQIRPCDLKYLPLFPPALKSLFADDYAEMTIKTIKRKRQRENATEAKRKLANSKNLLQTLQEGANDSDAARTTSSNNSEIVVANS